MQLTDNSNVDDAARGDVSRSVEWIGKLLMGQARDAGRTMLLLFSACIQITHIRGVLSKVVRQVAMAGFGSILVLSLIAGLTGMIMAMQTGFELQKFQLQDKLGAIIGATFLRELGPIWCAIITLARVGAAMAAELGSMAVNEEIDALRVMSINPVRYLVLPRILALVISMPLLTAIADFVGLAGGAVVSVQMFGVSEMKFQESAMSMLVAPDFWFGLFKSGVFACIIGSIACDQGMNTKDGAEGVGRATTATVVLSVIVVLSADFILTAFINHVLQPIFTHNA